MNKWFENQITLTASPELSLCAWEPNKFVTWTECHLTPSQKHIVSRNGPCTSTVACLCLFRFPSPVLSSQPKLQLFKLKLPIKLPEIILLRMPVLAILCSKSLSLREALYSLAFSVSLFFVSFFFSFCNHLNSSYIPIDLVRWMPFTLQFAPFWKCTEGNKSTLFQNDCA